MSVASEGVFLSALQPNSSTVSTYAVPSDKQLAHGGTLTDEAARSKRVQQQVALRLAEKSTLPRRTTTSTSQYATSDYGGSSTMTKYQSYNPDFSSQSYMYATTRPAMAHCAPQRSSGGYSSRSAIDFGTRSHMSQGGSATMKYNHDDLVGMAGMGGGYQGSQSQHYQMTTNRSIGYAGPDPETTSLHSLRMQSLSRQQAGNIGTWMTRNGSDGSLGSDQEATYSMSNGFSNTFPHQTIFSTTSNQVATAATLPSMRNAMSSTYSRGGNNGFNMDEETMFVRQGFKGPSQRTINRITQNRQYRNSMSAGSMQGGATGTYSAAGSHSNLTMMKGRMSRAPSLRSVASVGRGKDVFDGIDLTGSMGNLSGLNALDLHSAVGYLSSSDVNQQLLGAAYIQHECYNNKDSRKKVNELNGMAPLVCLFVSESQEVQQYATGAVRNLIYESMENKNALIAAGGIPQLMKVLKEPDDEIQKNITGILWNLSSKDNLKDKVAKECLKALTADVIVPIVSSSKKEFFNYSASEEDIFFNATGCLRNLSSLNAGTRKQMKETEGLIDSLVDYANYCKDEIRRLEAKGMENVMCVLRNLSYQVYDEISSQSLIRLEGPNRLQDNSRVEPIGCFTPQSKKAKDFQKKSQEAIIKREMCKTPLSVEKLWHPTVVELYQFVLENCESNSTTREAAAGALQNITAGDKRWPAILSNFALDQKQILPVLLNCLKTAEDHEMRSLTGFLRNLCRHASDKDALASKVTKHLVTVLPNNSNESRPSSDVVVNICGAFNNLVTCSEVAARDIAFFDGLPKLVQIKNNDSLAKTKQRDAAATVLSNMYQYKKLHKDYKKKGFLREDFTA